MTEIVAILCSDVHFCHTPPIARSEEPNWYEALFRPWEHILDLSANGDIPVIIAGDIFDRWNSPVELVNFVGKLFKPFRSNIFCIPGQHDLPNHRYDKRQSSAYYSLELMNVIHDLPTDHGVQITRNLRVWAFPWEHPVTPMTEPKIGGVLDLAVVHEYLWKQGKEHAGADGKYHISKLDDKLTGYDAAVFGDNHQGFYLKSECGGKMVSVLNSGTLYRRTTKERHYPPQIGFLKSNGDIQPYFLDHSEDYFIDINEVDETLKELDEEFTWTAQLSEASIQKLDFKKEVQGATEEPAVREEINSILEEAEV